MSALICISDTHNYCIYLHISAFACINLECLKSWERAGLAQVDEVREVDELLKALEKRQVHI